MTNIRYYSFAPCVPVPPKPVAIDSCVVSSAANVDQVYRRQAAMLGSLLWSRGEIDDNDKTVSCIPAQIKLDFRLNKLIILYFSNLFIVILDYVGWRADNKPNLTTNNEH